MLTPLPIDPEKQVEPVPAAADGQSAAPGVTTAEPRKSGPARQKAALYRLLSPRQLGILLVLLALTVAAGILARPHLQAWYHRRAARLELQNYHTAQAIRHLRLCRDVWPRDPEALLMAARAARRARVYDDTERLLEMYRQVRGRDDAFLFEYLLLLAERDLDPVADQCWQYVEEGRYDVPMLLESLTRGYLRQYRLDKARHCLDRWRQLQPDHPQASYLEGLLRFDYLHDRSGAAENFRRALQRDPDHEEARLGLAVALLGGKEYSPAAEHLKYLRQCQPDNVRVQVGLAECLDGLGETAEAIQLVDEVLAREPKSVAALSLRGQLAFKEGQWAEAESWLRQTLQFNPMDHRAHYSLILCLERNGREEEARQEQRQLKQREEDVALFNEIVTKDIAQHPNDPALHCTAGQILLRSGQREEGIRWLQRALVLDPKYVPARQALADFMRQPKP